MLSLDKITSNKMNKSIYFTAICVSSMLAGLSQAQAQTNVTLYGLVDAGIEISNSGKGTLSRLITGGTGGSRVGVRGREDLGGGLFATFNLEMGLATDTGALTQGGKAFGRGSNIGLQHKEIGTVLVGLVNLPYYQVQSKVDAFDWRANGGLMAISRPGAKDVLRIMPITTSARAENAIAFISNNYNGFQFRALGAFSENSVAQGNTYSTALSYSKNSVDLHLGYAVVDAANNSPGKAKAYVIGGSYDFKKFKVYAGYTVEKNSCLSCTGSLKMGSGIATGGASEFKLMNIGVRIPQGKATWMLQGTRIFDRSDYAINPGSRDSTWLALGMEYALSKRTLIYTSIGTLSNQNGSSYALGSGTASANAGDVGTNNPRSTTAVVGIRHNF